MANAFWVYCDDKEKAQALVGEDRSNLLRILPNNAADGDWCVESLDPYYFPIYRRYISTIAVRICDGESNDIVLFVRDIVCVLHFRKSV